MTARKSSWIRNFQPLRLCAVLISLLSTLAIVVRKGTLPHRKLVNQIANMHCTHEACICFWFEVYLELKAKIDP